ncbi:type II toxin-antitoxin system RelE/ParE family toxin [Gardnerella swidsinskii]|uniref:Addiction module toxin RelE n=1 Tax=Gardnerella swidsinskii TaxID=2792979 RepID=A0ABM6GJK0_9BIFI|nr:type II toxin-antitoxin system RelE/ParE family toxin [Gardnerella swidsinskii]APW18821.1 addiction module toxin RelE [Gardnerella vaginalis]UQA88671.1 type II toxin-antitoxin system RelE/ParE family toxin [Gardnerella swidsinskii]DAY24250.1 MAG TPA: ParE toxin of type II toxin-antitoxin system, parDE [Caudoviricetes sp.]
MSTTYNIIYSPQAFLDLTELYEYIRFTSQVPKTAEKQVNRIKYAIRSLETMPMRYPPVAWEPWHSVGIRRVSVDNYTVFYQVDENQMTVTVIRIFYSGRNIENIVNDSNN